MTLLVVRKSEILTTNYNALCAWENAFTIWVFVKPRPRLNGLPMHNGGSPIKHGSTLLAH